MNNMKLNKKKVVDWLLALALCIVNQALLAITDEHFLTSIVTDKFRTDISKSRDKYRHPIETLSFFGIEPDMTVVELWPGGGWYTDILAPYLKDKGKLIAAHYNPQTNHPFAGYFKNSLIAFESKVETNPKWYGRVDIRAFEPPFTKKIIADSSADMVLVFRNFNHWMSDGTIDDVLFEIHAMLKTGGILGVVENRASVYAQVDSTAENGYVNQQWFVQKLHQAGFQMLANNEINANPLDTANYVNGVWSLPPYLRVPEGEDERVYVDIGESDRFTIQFIKLGQ